MGGGINDSRTFRLSTKSKKRASKGTRGAQKRRSTARTSSRRAEGHGAAVRKVQL